ncbi:MAG TPA: GNAT family N-acetyltransferase [Candidatus Angelobacter sp.]|nr:GNAT family N-acetyltransferase [Candidatus Angelobacter sp.]
MFTIRVALIEEADEVARIINAAFEVERPFRLRGDRTSTEDVRQLMSSGNTFFLAEENRRIVGTVYVRINGQTGYFGMLSVDPTLQRNGIGRALREHVEGFCKQRGCREMTLTTGDFRTELLPYYARAGYRVVSTEPGSPEWSMRNEFRIVHMAKAL